MDSKTNELITAWRNVGVIKWAESEYGWITEEGKPITLLDWQRAILQAWHDHRDTCTNLAISNIKKTGKTLANEILLAWRWLALPGQHFAVGNDIEQGAARQISDIADMVRRNSYLLQNVKITKTELVFIPSGSTLTALAADAAGNAGANHLTASHTEAWGIIYEQGIRAWEELTPPPGKRYGLPAMRIADSYAGFEGESKTWHDLVDRGLNGDRISKEWGIYKNGGLILFHAEGEWARDHCFRGSHEEAEEYYKEQKATLRPNAFIRMHGNQRTAGEGSFIPVEAWENCYSPEVHPLQEGQDRRVVIGVDASTTRDLTALVGVETDKDGISNVALVRVWKPVKGLFRHGKPTVDLAETIGAEVMRLHKQGQLSAIVADPYQLHSLILEWERAGIKVIELAQNAGRVESDQGLYDAIIGHSLRHYNDPALNEAIRNAVAIETPRGMRLAKEKAVKKIDPAVALSMALYGAINQAHFERNNQGGVVPDVIDYYEGYDTQKDFIYWHHPDGTRDFTFAPGANHKPHPPGVTWRNCRYRNTGCQACVDEQENDPQCIEEQKREDEYLAHVIPMTEEEAAEDFLQSSGIAYRLQKKAEQEDRKNEIKQRFFSRLQ